MNTAAGSHDSSGQVPPRTAAPGALLAAGESLNDRMGIEILEFGAERTVGTMPVAPNRQPYGLLHGGASAVLAETLGSIAAFHGTPPGKVPVGIELNCTHHRSARTGLVTGTATRISGGGTLATYDITIVDERDRLVCTSRLTCMYIDGQRARQATRAALADEDDLDPPEDGTTPAGGDA